MVLRAGLPHLLLDNMEFDDVYYGARPKRQIRPPTHFDDYEVNYIRHRQRDRHGQDEECTSHEEGAAKMTALGSPHVPFIDHHGRDAAPDEADMYYRERQMYSPETQLAHLRYPERDLRREIREPPPLPHAIQECSAILQQSQRTRHADVERLHEVRAGSGRLTNSTPAHIEDEEDWPDPPPWIHIEDYEEPFEKPVIERLE